MKSLVPVVGLAMLACPLFAGAAAAQAVEGQSFYATPMSHGGITAGTMAVETTAPPPPPPVAAPVAPPPAKHKARKHKPV